MNFQKYLKQYHSLTWRQWSLKPEPEKMDIYRDWATMPQTDGPAFLKISWGFAAIALVIVVGIVTHACWK